jgi:uncharacterized protein YkwD
MRRGTFARLLLLAIAVASIVAFPSTVNSKPAASSAAILSVDAIEPQMLQLINDYRDAHGLKPLHSSAALARAANVHAREMAKDGFFAHSSADGTSAGTRIRRYYRGGSHWMVGETLLWRSPTVDAGAAVGMWINSGPHRHILLTGGFKDVGIAAVHASPAPGVYGGMDVTIVVADFGARG